MRYVLVSMLLSGLIAVQAEDASGFGRDSLQGVSGVWVTVNHTTVDVTRASPGGLSQDEIRIAVELILRSNGIRVLTKEEIFTVRTPANLVISSTAIRFHVNDVFYVYILTGDLHQMVRLRYQSEKETGVVTWDRGTIVAIDALQLSKKMIENAESLAKDFANDFLSVNPR